MSWGKIDPELLPDTVVAYVDSTMAMPLIASYVLARCKPRKPRRLYKRLKEMEEALRAEYLKSDLYARYWPAEAAAAGRAPPDVPPAASPLSGKPRRRTRR